MKNRHPAIESRRRLLRGLLAATATAALSPARAASDAMDGAHAGQHDHHHHAPAQNDVKRSTVMYRIPSVTLLRQDGSKAAFPQELDGGQPVLLDFIYTSCTAVCPLTSQIFSQVQDGLGAERDKVRMVSISIDPEYDTPARLTEFARKYHAMRQWQHYTGTVQASLAIQKAFDAYRGDKMSHFPVTFLRAAPGKPWSRLEGFASAELLIREYRSLVMNT